MITYQLAQINIAKAKDTLESNTMKGFVDRIDEINALADNSKGFIWRLESEYGDATALQVFDDPTLIINMSVWDDIDSLKEYVYKSVHVELIRGKKSWFDKMLQSHQALWWIPTGYIPTIDEGKERLEYLENNGPSNYSFTFNKAFKAPK